MPKKPRAKRGSPKNVLRLPDLNHAKASVLQSLCAGLKKLLKTRLFRQFPRAAFCKLLDDQREVRTLRQIGRTRGKCSGHR
jgi:hypothetical protein